MLAYLREHPAEDGTVETLLCVYNLSRSAQAVELDLSAIAGRLPVDIVGGSVFPAGGAAVLSADVAALCVLLVPARRRTRKCQAWHTPQPEALPEFCHHRAAQRSIEEVRPGYGRTVLENEALPAYLPKRRWFASKTETLTGVKIAYFA